MSKDLSTKEAQALLVSAQALRTHWSSLITHIMSFAILTNVAVWTFFLQAYFGNFQEYGAWAHSYIASASTISIALLVIWRWYTQYLDNNIVQLYPELVYYEQQLSCPSQYGTSGLLKRVLGSVGNFLLEDRTAEQKAYIIGQLVNRKLIGGRGHGFINWLTLAAIVSLAFIVFGLGIFELEVGVGAAEQGFVRLGVKIVAGVISGLSVVGMVILLIRGQRNPCEQQVQNIITRVKELKSNDLG